MYKRQVKELEKLFSSANALVLAEYRGLTVTEQTKLRRELKNAGATFNVVKMSLAKRAAENIGYESILEHFAGPTGVAVIESDPVEAAKVLKQFSKDYDSFVVKGGLMESEPLTIDQINILASIETRDVLLAKIAGGFNSPLTKMALGLKGVLSKSGYAFKALLDMKEANPETSSEAKESDSSKEDSEDVIKEEE